MRQVCQFGKRMSECGSEPVTFLPVCLLRGPVNEDVFAAPPYHGGKIVDSDIQEISEQIHRLLLQVWTHAWPKL